MEMARCWRGFGGCQLGVGVVLVWYRQGDGVVLSLCLIGVDVVLACKCRGAGVFDQDTFLLKHFSPEGLRGSYSQMFYLLFDVIVLKFYRNM